MYRTEGSYEQYQRKVSNEYMSQSREHSFDIAKVYRQMEYYRPVVSQKKNEDEKSTQHLQDSLGNAVQKCYKYDRSKSECSRARNYRFDKKADRRALNSQEVVAEKFRMMKEKA